MYRYYLEKYILDHVLQFLGEAGIAVISLFIMKEGKLNVFRQDTARSLQRVIICIKLERFNIWKTSTMRIYENKRELLKSG